MGKERKMGRYADKKWQDIFLVRSYEMARSGLKDSQIADALGVSRVTFTKWKEDKPALNDALSMGRVNQSKGNGVQRFLEYTYDRLPPDLKELWDEIKKVDEGKSNLVSLEAILQDAGEKARQELFFHALVHYNFNPSHACRAVNVSKDELDRWVTSDPDFARLVEQMHWHKKNLFEGKLVELVMQGDPSAVIFANKTHNRDRGYNDKVEVDVKHTHTHKHSHRVKVSTLSLEAKKEMLAQLRAKQLPEHVEAEDAEYVEKE